jgi:hypothetical protein
MPGDAGGPVHDLYRGIPQLTVIDPSLHHVDSTRKVVLLAQKRGQPKVACVAEVPYRKSALLVG